MGIGGRLSVFVFTLHQNRYNEIILATKEGESDERIVSFARAKRAGTGTV